MGRARWKNSRTSHKLFMKLKSHEMPTNEDEKEIIISHTKHEWRTLAKCSSCVKSGIIHLGPDFRKYTMREYIHISKWASEGVCAIVRNRTDGRKETDFTLNENRVQYAIPPPYSQRCKRWRSFTSFQFGLDQLYPRAFYFVPFTQNCRLLFSPIQ